MAIGPRLEVRQSQSLVMTPQLRQAIKLLHFTNLEVASYVEEELQKNPMLERDDRSETVGERPALDQLPPSASSEASDDLSRLLRTGEMPSEAASPLDSDASAVFDLGGAADGAPDDAIPGMSLANMRGGANGFETDDRGIDETIEAGRNLRDHLSEQLRLNFRAPVDRMIGANLLALLEACGRVSVTDEAIAGAMGIGAERVASVRARMLQFDPVGMFAVDLKQCLAAQLIERNRLDPAMAALLDNLELLAKRDRKKMMEVCGVDAEDLTEMMAEIRALDPKPGANYDDALPQTVIADVLMRRLPDHSWALELNPETLPRVLVNQRFHTKVTPNASKADKAFIAEQLSSANWLVRALQQRAQTILRVASEIVRRQEAFFEHGVSHLRPLILRDIAEAVELHESTVSRVTSNKYMATPRGTFELKFFFTTAISGTNGGDSHSAESVRHRIRALIDAERVKDILSDDTIVSLLRKEGVDIARRTVAKYREALGIPSSVQRKREKAVPA